MTHHDTAMILIGVFVGAFGEGALFYFCWGEKVRDAEAVRGAASDLVGALKAAWGNQYALYKTTMTELNELDELLHSRQDKSK